MKALALTLLLLTAPAAAQEPPVATTREFRLDIEDRTYEERDFQADVAVAARPSEAVEVQVGAVVQAETLTARLQGVHGTVRFRGDLRSLLQRD